MISNLFMIANETVLIIQLTHFFFFFFWVCVCVILEDLRFFIWLSHTAPCCRTWWVLPLIVVVQFTPRTSYKTLKHKSSGFCVHPLSGTPKSGTSAILWQDDCNEDRLQLDLFKLPGWCKNMDIILFYCKCKHQHNIRCAFARKHDLKTRDRTC